MMSKNDTKKQKLIKCLVLFLDDSQHTFEVEKRSKGEQLMDLVFRHLELIEKDYFGLEFMDKETRRWLDPTKLITKQLRPPYLFYFKVKFYVNEPSRLLEEYTRYHFFLQLRRDILLSKLHAPPQSLVLLASYVAQSELGDYCPDEHQDDYLSNLKFVSNQNAQFEAQVASLHKHHKGQTPADAELNYLEIAKNLDLYGIELHPAHDSHGNQLQIGVSGNGLAIFDQQGVRVNSFSWAKIIKISFKRRNFFIQLRREGEEDYDSLLGFNLISYRACKSLWKSCVEQHTFFRLETPKPHTKKFFFFLSLGSKFRYSGKTQYQTYQENKKRLTRTQRTFVRTRSSRFTRQTFPIPSHVQNLMLSSHGQPNGTSKNVNSNSSQSSVNNNINNKHHHHHDKIMSASDSPARKMKFAWNDQCDSSDDGIYINNYSPLFCPSSMVPYIDEPPSPTSPVHLITINLKPDSDGKFGFNVKGGSDQNCPILVSRVAPNTPADLADPKMKEGDQVMAINGADCDGKTHQEIVDLIRNTRGEGATLVLTIRPNVSISPSNPEPEFQFIPLSSPDQLRESMALIHQGLENEDIIYAFDNLARDKPGETLKAANSMENVHKNRYRDIKPYDSTRVVLQDSMSGDYINASYVNMKVGDLLLKYIATQGPLADTVDDFWSMVWQEKSELIVMVTPLQESGRPKCHKYWPDNQRQYGHVIVNLVSEKDDRGIVERQFDVKDKQSSTSLRVTQLQYLLWPDHGVPKDYHDFLSLINKVRAIRGSSCGQPPSSGAQPSTNEHPPVIVHCSAGIGRTGVLILMETALCLMESKRPVKPLELVEEMRTQRAMLIQTAAQFKFVCEAVWRVWNEKMNQSN